MKEKIHPRTQAIGVRVLIIYLVMTLAEIILLNIGDMNLFDSICHSFGTVSTGGFSTHSGKLHHYSPYSQYVVMVFMLLAGTSQLIYYYIGKRNFKKVKQNEELWFFLGVVTISGIAATLILMINSGRSLEESFRHGFFQTLSMISCTGFVSTDYLLWPSAGILLLFILMFAGGCTGSPSGGIKMGRHLVVLKNIKGVFVRLNHPSAMAAIKLNGKVLSESANISIISFVVLYLFLFIIGSVIVTATGSDPLTSASSVASCMAGIGPGMGDVGPMGNYAGMTGLAKLVLSLLMMLGRLEILTVFALFSKSFWKL